MTICEVIPADRIEPAWRAVVVSVFGPGPTPFADPFLPAWHTILLPGAWHMGEEEAQALAAGARAVGDTQGIVVELGDNAVSHALRFDLSSDGLLAAQGAAGPEMLLGLSWGIFGPSGRWGALMWESDWSWVGGDQIFMRAVTGALGGGPLARRRFAAWLQDWWGDNLPESETTGFLDRPTWAVE